MAILLGISDWIIPLIMIGIVIYGLLKEVDVFEAFVEGAMDGLKVVVDILPTLIGLLVAVGMLRASGALTGLSKLIAPLISFSHFPPGTIPVVLLHSFSSSAATGLIIDIFKTYGPDSFIGRLVSIIFSCTETIFYTMSVYFMTIKVRKSRYTLSGALVATLAGVIAAYYLTLKFFGL
ncbi:MAG: spore maturation protein [Candidatus Cellulosilyticum pullistercoris]|uniref:Spore maturation protein n=1 Tax=Candidatus Cellulosilyticum pullistercoris TaxID=2838521 RepID=A0A9E2NK56_9FIRM|nr:spore maturation protein [Candidatus Cellulosilyticum pullistercoris]